MVKGSKLANSAVAVAGLALILAGTAVNTAWGQQILPRIWDVQPGTHVTELPQEEFVDPACGTNGGPPGRFIGGFEQFESCPAEASGLREIWFIYDDELEFVARAIRNLSLSGRHRATTVLGQPVILSLLIDRAGLVQGYRIFTDPHAAEELRMDAYTVAIAFKARFGNDGWECTDTPQANGETPYQGIFVKQRCQKLSDGRRIVVESRNYRKPGQTLMDPYRGLMTVNEFESSARLELIREEPAPRRVAVMKRPAAAERDPALAALQALDPRAAFLSGQTVNCPGCDLAGLGFKRRDLTGADLSGANLKGASFHRAILRRANLSGANLEQANLNRAILTLANLQNANLGNAMLFESDAARANFSGAALNYASMGKARLTLANFQGANLEFADLGEAKMNDATLANATLTNAFLHLADLFRANMRGVIAERAYLVEARLRGADLSGANLRDSDLFSADLGDADLSNADFGGTRLLSANLLNANQSGTIFTGALMPDNSPHR